MIRLQVSLRLFACLIGLLPALTACGFSGGPIDGVVLEEGTNKPIPGAVVVVRWDGNNWSGLVDGQRVCYHVETAFSDEQGKYRIPRWSDQRIGQSFFVNDRQVSVFAYKAGYEWVLKDTPKQELQYLDPFKGDRRDRLQYLVRLHGGTGCGSPSESEKNRIPFLKNLYEEAQPLAHTDDEKRKVESIRYDLEIRELGFEKAQKRYLDRAQEK